MVKEFSLLMMTPVAICILYVAVVAYSTTHHITRSSVCSFGGDLPAGHQERGGKMTVCPVFLRSIQQLSSRYPYVYPAFRVTIQ